MTPSRLLLALLTAGALPMAAQRPGFSPATQSSIAAHERAAIAAPDTARSRVHARALASAPHVAGTDGQARTRDYVIAQMQAMGLETAVREYQVFLPHPTEVRAWRVSPAPRELSLAEGPVAGDAVSALPEVPPINGYGGTGDVTAEVVYVNYGLIEDYAQLEAAGVSVRGKIAIARYGRSFRGIKAREAERRGAVGLFIYSDPADDGFVRGDVYPEGPWRPPHGVQRGSVMNGAGDPTTPGWPSTAGARREPLTSLAVPRIPVVPISYGNAQELLREVRGAVLPEQGWQGGLPFRYHVGPGPVQARLRVQTDTATRAFKPIWNTLGTIRGREFPDELVIIGGHRDSWGAGAQDNVSGVTSILEAARALSDRVKAGWRPRRTIVFATWDAEEWGLVGSSEYVEDDSLRLQRGAVAYLNLDVSAGGPNFGGGGSPSLRALLRDVARTVDDPTGSGSVYDVWRRRTAVAAGREPAMGDPGGGSDFAGFYNHFGIPHADWGFGGGGGIYHSAYDTPAWMERFGDPSYAYHATAARLAAAMLMRLADADVVPFDYAEFARTVQGYVPGIERSLAAKGWSAVSLAPVTEALAAMERSATAFAAARDSVLARPATPPGPALAQVNAALRRVERALTRPEGIPSRPWYRSVIYASDVDNGYGTMALPGVQERVRYGTPAQVRDEVADLAARVRRATAALDDATRALRW